MANPDHDKLLKFINSRKSRRSVHRPKCATKFRTSLLKAYVEAVEGAFGGVDYAQLVKLYGSLDAGKSAARRYSPAECTGIIKRRVEGNPEPAAVSTSCVERSSLTMQMGMRRFTRPTNTFGKKVENHLHMLSIFFCYYNFCRIHKTLKVTPAMAAGVDERLRDMEWLVGLIDARTPAPAKPGPKPGTGGRPRKSN